MPNIFGLDLSPLLDGIKTAVGGMVGESSAQPRDPFQGYQPQGTDPFAGLTYTGSSGSYQPQGHDPFAGWQGGGSDPFAGLSYGTMGSTFASNDPNQSFGANPLFAAFDAAHQNKLGFLASEEAKKATIGKGVVVGAAAAGGGGPSAGMAPGVAKWADQTKQVFGDIMDPDIMLAVMTNESGGDPNAYNAAGDAWGLFQNVGLGSNDPDVQFTAARTLAQQKLASIQQSYAANGLNPDERTRARDFALAWAGHFSYDTGLPNPGSRDVGSGQTADQLSAIFLKNYDAIKAGRQAPAVGGARVTPSGYAFPVVGFTGQVQDHWGTERGGSDIMAPEGTPVVAMRGGRVIDASYNNLGGNTVTIQGDDGNLYYMAHLRDAPLVQAGQQVAAGAPLGFVGTTGNAAGGPAHLHLGIGKTIISGGGSTGGLGSGIDAVALLQGVLGGH